MAVYAVAGINSTAKYQNLPRINVGASIPKAANFTSPSGLLVLSRPKLSKNHSFHLLVANNDRLVTETSAEKAQLSPSNDQKPAASTKLEPPRDQIPDASNGSKVSSDLKQENESSSSTSTKSPIKRTRLTARAKLKAAIVSRNSESKPRSKPQLGKNVLDALKEIEKRQGKAGLPEAPSNLLDDSKRGMPPKGLTWELPVGVDVALIILSVVLISTIMFTTTYIVWKVGAIHFNEY